MSDTNWTPGPWRVGMDNGMNANIIAGPDDFWVCQVYGIAINRSIDECLESEGITNAHLIAAAPELYEALEEVVRISDRKHDAWDKAKTALAKARGEQQ